jgi:hypothetical protein
MLKGIKMNSFACLLGPKKYPCASCWFGCLEMGVLKMDLYVFIHTLSSLNPFFLLCRFVKV